MAAFLRNFYFTQRRRDFAIKKTVVLSLSKHVFRVSVNLEGPFDRLRATVFLKMPFSLSRLPLRLCVKPLYSIKEPTCPEYNSNVA
jgi:hypothetical protein